METRSKPENTGKGVEGQIDKIEDNDRKTIENYKKM